MKLMRRRPVSSDDTQQRRRDAPNGITALREYAPDHTIDDGARAPGGGVTFLDRTGKRNSRPQRSGIETTQSDTKRRGVTACKDGGWEEQKTELKDLMRS